MGATRGLARSLLAQLAEPDVTHVASAFDQVIESFRNDLFDGYKTGEGIEPEPRRTTLRQRRRIPRRKID